MHVQTPQDTASPLWAVDNREPSPGNSAGGYTMFLSLKKTMAVQVHTMGEISSEEIVSKSH